MATNQYFKTKVRSEQQLFEDLVIESLQMFGQDVYYLPREIVNKDKLFLDEDAIVYTSGSGGNFRAGLPIGKINNEIENLAVDFFSDLSQLSLVKIQSIESQID